MTERLLNAKLIAQIFRQAEASETQRDKSATEREAMLRSLRSKRQDILNDRFKANLLTDQEARQMLKPIDAEIKALEARTPAEAPARRVSAAEFVKAIEGYFARYASKSIEKQRELLERAVSDIIVSGRGILSVTFRGGFLAAVNLPMLS